jgi:hypothetical protein
MSLKDKLKHHLSLPSLTDTLNSCWDLFIVRASVGCLLLTTIFYVCDSYFSTTETLIHSTQCADSPTFNAISLSNSICSERVLKAIPTKQATKATGNTFEFIFTTYYFFGALLGNILYTLYGFVRSITPRVYPFIFKQKNAQFEKDVNWCMTKIEQHFSGQPYWEEWNIAAFSRQGKGDARYWADVNQEATKRITAIPTTLHYQEAYREMNRMALFSLNVIASALLYTDEGSQHSNTLEDIIELTHQQLIRRAPSAISEHDEALRCLQTCLNHFCHILNAPQSDFVYYSNMMNKLRISNINR